MDKAHGNHKLKIYETYKKQRERNPNITLQKAINIKE